MASSWPSSSSSLALPLPPLPPPLLLLARGLLLAVVLRAVVLTESQQLPLSAGADSGSHQWKSRPRSAYSRWLLSW